jgi:SAM-dependent methyltransferase
MLPDLIDKTYRCMACGFYSSELPVEINTVFMIDEDVRENALYPLREAGIKVLLEKFKDFINKGSTILDVGCAHGWFMTEAAKAGYVCYGIEPDKDMAERLRASKIDFMEGYFPDVLTPEQKYDVIAFHDVFEHLPDPDAILRAASDHLNEHGLLVINLPMSDGIFFKVARVLASFGLAGPLARLWQKGLPSPHLSYFSRYTLPHFVTRRGFRPIRAFDLPSVATSKLWSRIRYDTSLGFVRALGIFIGVLLMVPLTKITASDARCFVFRKI